MERLLQPWICWFLGYYCILRSFILLSGTVCSLRRYKFSSSCKVKRILNMLHQLKKSQTNMFVAALFSCLRMDIQCNDYVLLYQCKLMFPHMLQQCTIHIWPHVVLMHGSTIVNVSSLWMSWLVIWDNMHILVVF